LDIPFITNRRNQAMRQLAFQIVDILAALLRVQAIEGVEELKTIAIFCGAGLNVSLLCLANGWFETLA
jgi:hypothetical protein